MTEAFLASLAAVLLGGIALQWAAWRFQLPAILLLLTAGFVAGPVLGLLDPRHLLGELLEPVVSVSVALILYEGGLSLDLRELKTVGRAVRNLVTIGALVTWGMGSVAAWLLFDIPPRVALVLGAILVVTGPTVIGPLLRHIRPAKRVGSILRWEGILIDPIGAVLAVLVFESAVAGTIQHAPVRIIEGVLVAAGVGGGIGLAAAALLVIALRRYWVPDFLHNAASIAMVVGAFTAANAVQGESGLVAVTVMGIALASQRFFPVTHIVEFKENLRILLLSGLFILLAAQLDLQDLATLGPREAIFVGILIVIVRPVSVLISTFRTQLDWRERAFLSWVAPRGVVAAAISSVFALRLAEEGVPGAEVLVPVTFIVVAATIAVYGLTTGLIARRLGLAVREPKGILIAGAHGWARTLAEVLRDEGFDVSFADTDWSNVTAARLKGFRAYFGSAISEHALDTMDLANVGRVLALTPNDELNALVCQRFGHIVGSANTFQLPPRNSARGESIALHQRGRLLFGEHLIYAEIQDRVMGGAGIKSTPLTRDFDFAAFRERYGRATTPLFAVSEQGVLLPFATDKPPEPKAGQKLISLVPNGASS